MQKAIVVDSTYSDPYNFIGIYYNELAKLTIKARQADSVSTSNSYFSVLQNLTEAERYFRIAHRLDAELTSPMYNLCLALYYHNIIDFNFFQNDNEKVNLRILQRCNEIDRITDELLNSKRIKMFDKFYEIKYKAQQQKQETIVIFQ